MLRKTITTLCCLITLSTLSEWENPSLASYTYNPEIDNQITTELFGVIPNDPIIEEIADSNIVDTLDVAKLEQDLKPSLPTFSNRDLRSLAQMIRAEAGNEPEIGQIAVAYTAINRQKLTKQYGKRSVHELINQKRQYAQSPKISDAHLSIARNVLLGLIPDPTHGATHFYSQKARKSKAPPYWATKFPLTIEIFNHRFYRIS